MATHLFITTTSGLSIPVTGVCGDRQVVRAWAVVADDDFGREVAGVPWCMDGVGYVRRRRVGRLHRLVFTHYHGSVPEDTEIDHIDRDRLNNRPNNLRAVSHSGNMVNVGRRPDNSSGFVGVAWHKRAGKWRAYVRQHGRQRHLGLYDSAEAAAAQVNAAYADIFPHVPPPNSAACPA